MITQRLLASLSTPWMPAITVFIGVIIQEMALPWQGWSVMRPDFSLIILIYWRLYRPDHAGPLLAFSSGLALDALAGTPLMGLTAASRLLIVMGIGHFGNRLRAAEFLVIATAITLLAFLERGSHWLLLGSVQGFDARLSALLMQPVATALLSPLVITLLISIHKTLLENDVGTHGMEDMEMRSTLQSDMNGQGRE
ncbi:MAG: rod shape-determining protein MreD [Magnetococcales bacterium]|nr:rod shape-determining protein MreD [Magnetococcales bacterium]